VRSLLAVLAVIVLVGLEPLSVGGTQGRDTAPTPGRRDAAPPRDAPTEEPDPPEVAIGERLFLETRFAQFFFANSGGDANAALAAGDPVTETSETRAAPLPGPFAGAAMNCRACHLVDEHGGVAEAGNRTYADFARRSPVPRRGADASRTPRNAPALVNASLPLQGLLHFDGEFVSLEDLIRSSFTSRNFGWQPGERDQAVAHLAHIVRNDDGAGALAREFGGSYRKVLAGVDPAMDAKFRLPPRFRIDVDRASDFEILDTVARLVAAYVRSLVFIQDDEGAFSGSPYDTFLIKNKIPRKPDDDETDLAYSRRLRKAIDRLRSPRWVGRRDGKFRLHDQRFAFGRQEFEGLKAFLREPGEPRRGRNKNAQQAVGNCIACHPAPTFTDSRFHNTGVSQVEYDEVHGVGSFATLAIPDLATRNSDHDAFLPSSPEHPAAAGRFRDVPARDKPGHADLGLWNIFGNPDFPRPQALITGMLCAADGGCSARELLPSAIARFKTPGLRDLGHSAPYFHNGRADSLEDVVRFYQASAELARADRLRNHAPELAGISLNQRDIARVSAFLRALNEDYE
jgi:cytochrome c peroxidase